MKKYFLVLLCAVVIVWGIGVRFYHVDEESLWSDEAYTAIFLRDASFVDLLTGNAQDRFHPPLYYLLVEGWTSVFGDSEWALRLPSVIIGIFLIPAVFWFACSLTRNRSIALCSAALTALSPLMVAYSQEARNYGLYILIVVLHATAIWNFWNSPSNRKFWLAVATGVIGVYTHYGFWAILAAEAVYGIVQMMSLHAWKSRNAWLQLIGPYLYIGMSFIPWFLRSTYPRLLQRNEEFWAPPFAFVDFGRLLSEILFVPFFSFMLVLKIVGILAAFGIVGWLGFSRKFSKDFVYLGLLILIPVTMFALSGEWLNRYVFFIAPFLYVLIARIIHNLVRAPWGNIALSILLLLSVVGAVPVYQTAFSSLQKEDWRGTVQTVRGFDDGSGRIYLNKPFARFPFSYYYNGSSDVRSPQVVNITELPKYVKSMRDFPWVAVVYNHPTDVDGVLLNAANQVFSNHEIFAFKDIELHVFQHPRNP